MLSCKAESENNGLRGRSDFRKNMMYIIDRLNTCLMVMQDYGIVRCMYLGCNACCLYKPVHTKVIKKSSENHKISTIYPVCCFVTLF